MMKRRSTQDQVHVVPLPVQSSLPCFLSLTVALDRNSAPLPLRNAKLSNVNSGCSVTSEYTLLNAAKLLRLLIYTWYGILRRPAHHKSQGP